MRSPNPEPPQDLWLDDTKEAAVGCRFVFHAIIPKFKVLQKFFPLDTFSRYLVAVYNMCTRRSAFER
jgi:hypothetical protein